MKNNRLFFVSTLVSVAAHIVLLSGAYFIQVPAVKAVQPALLQQALFKVKTMELLQETGQSEGSGAKRTETYIQKIQFEKPAAGLDQKVKGSLMGASALTPTENLAPAPKALSLQDFAPRPLPGTSALGEGLKEQVVLPKRTAASPSSAIAQPVMYVPSENLVTEQEFLDMPGEFLEKMPAFTPEKISPSSRKSADVGDPLGLLSGGSHAYSSNPGFEPLDQYLGVKIQTYRDPEDNMGYYRISIYPFAEAKVLQVLPKEIVFLVDASLSIQARRLYAFKEAIKHALRNLNKDDLFNIYVFKSSIVPFAPRSLAASTEEIASAMEFLDELKPSQTTDIYSAFYETIQRPVLRQPSYAMLLSDGNATDGEVSTTKLIAEITRANNHVRPIFAFSGGARVNRFLLDFLAYPNRGWSEYAASNSEIRERLMEFTDKIQNPVLTNVRYQLTPLDENEIYPKRLTDIYQDTFFTIYGRFKDETRFSVRVTGEAGDVNKEFIFSGDLSQAPEGTRDIARFWAFNKVYHLISKMVLEGATAGEQKEVQELITRFGLEIPYRLEDIQAKK